MRGRFKLHNIPRARRRMLLGSSALLPFAYGVFGASSAFAQAVNLGHIATNSIVPDGRTATHVTVKGNVTDIRTSTFRGGNAYNSFSTFSEGAGNTVNLFVPKQAANLVNIVRNGAVDIEGTLNAYQNGKIGGNVVFADSYGMIVGKSGTINVGALTVVTPSGATLNSLIDANGHVNTALASQVIAGNVPLSPDGSVLIKGKINAQNFVTITAHDVKIAGSYEEAMRSATQRAQFEATVNSQGMREGGAIVAHNGSIEIVAAHDATIGGALTAGGSAGHGGAVSIAAGHNATIRASARVTAATGGAPASAAVANAGAAAPTISVEAAGTATIAGLLSAVTAVGGSPGEIRVSASDISVAATARLAAIGVGAVDGGHISVTATDTTTVAAGASFAANATGSGDGGLIEISGQTDNVAADISVALNAPQGKAGTLLFDPYDLYIGGGSDQGGPNTTADPTIGGAASTVASLYTDGASVVLDATNSIIVNGAIDTRKYAGDTTAPVAGLLSAAHPSTGNSGSITLDAPTITIASGGALYADVYNATTNGTATTYTPGAIALGASSGQTIAINGAVTGGAVSATATATIALTGSILGGPTTLSAGSSIALGASGLIDTRSLDPTGSFSIADSQSVALTAPTITTASVRRVHAGAINTADTGFLPGDIDLDATGASTGSIAVAGALSGGNITLAAGSEISLGAAATLSTPNATSPELRRGDAGGARHRRDGGGADQRPRRQLRTPAERRHYRRRDKGQRRRERARLCVQYDDHNLSRRSQERDVRTHRNRLDHHRSARRLQPGGVDDRRSQRPEHHADRRQLAGRGNGFARRADDHH